MEKKLEFKTPLSTLTISNTTNKITNKSMSFASLAENNTFDSEINRLSDDMQKDSKTFWKQINSFYFKDITENELQQIELLISKLHKSPTDELASQSTLNPLQMTFNQEEVKIIQNHNVKPYSIAESFPMSLMPYSPPETTNSDDCELTRELTKLKTKQRVTHIQNVQKLLELKDQMITKHDTLDCRHNFDTLSMCSNATTASNSTSPYTQRSQGKKFSPEEEATLQVNYLKKSILDLEDQQAAESVKYVVDCRKDPSQEGYEFCLLFDSAISDTEAWVQEDILDKLDKLREHSLFKICNIPQKTQYSLNTFNLAALGPCSKKMIHRTLDIQERPWKNILRKSFGDNSNENFNMFYKDQMMAKVRQLDMCHQCRYLFPQEFLVSCHYKSSKMGLSTPAIAGQNTNGTENVVKAMEMEGSLPYLYKWKEVQEEYVCDRKFCRNCLKSNYNITHQSIMKKVHWICPFCKGDCSCSRCLRNDSITKLVDLYTCLKGDPKPIKQESCLRKYVWSTIKRKFNQTSDQLITLPRLGTLKKAKPTPAKKSKPKKVQEPSLEPPVKKKQKVVKEEKSFELPSQNRLRTRSSYRTSGDFFQSQEEVVPKKNFYKTTNASGRSKLNLQIEIPQINGNIEGCEISSTKEQSLETDGFFNKEVFSSKVGFGQEFDTLGTQEAQALTKLWNVQAGQQARNGMVFPSDF